MTRYVRPSIGLIGQIVAILLLTIVIEFGRMHGGSLRNVPFPIAIALLCASWRS